MKIINILRDSFGTIIIINISLEVYCVSVIHFIRLISRSGRCYWMRWRGTCKYRRRLSMRSITVININLLKWHHFLRVYIFKICWLNFFPWFCGPTKREKWRMKNKTKTIANCLERPLKIIKIEQFARFQLYILWSLKVTERKTSNLKVFLFKIIAIVSRKLNNNNINNNNKRA